MKTLTTNFTNIEQSQTLLDLGLPAWTADCKLSGFKINMFHNLIPKEERIYSILVLPPDQKYKDQNPSFNDAREIFPCWSVGRLIEIYNECIVDDKEEITIPKGHIVLQRVLILFFAALQYGWFDFSKLED